MMPSALAIASVQPSHARLPRPSFLARPVSGCHFQVLDGVELTDCFCDPTGVLGFTSGSAQAAWDLRDRLRLRAVDMHPMFITRDDSEYSFDQVRRSPYSK